MNIPTHIAFIMDGNGRWAKNQNKKRVFGHYEGAKRLKDIVNFSVEKKIKFVSFFAFGIDNWKRPNSEVLYIWNLVKKFLTKKSIKWLMDNNVRFRWIGFPDKIIKKEILKLLNDVVNLTKNNNGTSINLFMNYSGRADILNAVNLLKNNSEKITEKKFNSKLLTSDLPDVDLLIRTSGEERISNFMLWQISYSEIIFSKLMWPEFGVKNFIDCINIYNKRVRRFGGL
ncbi:polyprenyl diphosphate synthase [Mycoplasmoides pirum]|uniref:polyprenyl diphosphate synthase n=1 Tax=Mycoplasmoides pirum TaxID=2122 RepID=UPI0009DD56FA|nr:polyprenyl diphosphate synthase [Mycoplasmoides pirum]